MVSHENNGNGVASDALPPPPPSEEKVMRVPMARLRLATKGHKVSLLANHCKVNVSSYNGHFFHYTVALFYEDGRSVDAKGVGRKVINRIYETHGSKLAGKEFAYDGEKSLFTFGALPRNKLKFTVVLEDVTSNRNKGNTSPDRTRMLCQSQSRIFKVELSFTAKIPMRAIGQALRGEESENSQEAFRILDIILRQHAAKQGCLLVRQSFFHNDVNNFADVGGGLLGCKGFHSSFRTSQSGLSLNIDVSTTVIIQSGPVVEFLLNNQNVKNPWEIDWEMAERTLKNLRVISSSTNREYKIIGLSKKHCGKQLFSMKVKSKDENGEPELRDVNVYDYFVNYRKIRLNWSGTYPCVNVGRPKRPTYIPLELCSLLPLQRYTNSLTIPQRASLVEKFRQNPREKLQVLSHALEINNYDSEPFLKSCGISTCRTLTQVDGIVLQAPKLKAGNGEDFFPRNGRWDFHKKKVFEPVKIKKLAVADFFSLSQNRMHNLLDDFFRCGTMLGIQLPASAGIDIYVESHMDKRCPPVNRINKMVDHIIEKSQETPQIILCLLPAERNSSYDLYGLWKKKCLVDLGVVTQCMVPVQINDVYLSNVILKINAKLGGLNSILAVERTHLIPIVSKDPTMILGMHVSHSSPGNSNIPSIAAVVSSRCWPLISCYRASLRIQSPKVEVIDSLFKKVSDTRDDGIMKELLLDFYNSSGKKPDHIIIFRDGVRESQFTHILNNELDQIIEACKFLDDTWFPKFAVIISQRNHHTKFFRQDSWDNVSPGTVIDNVVCHPTKNDFYMCAHAGKIGTTRPTHYDVLIDEIGFSTNDLQELVHSLSYVYQRGTSAISEVAPIRYAHLAATQVGQFMKFEEFSESSSSHDGTGVTSAGAVPDSKLPRLHQNVRNTMFFC